MKSVTVGKATATLRQTGKTKTKQKTCHNQLFKTLENNQKLTASNGTLEQTAEFQ